MCTTIESSTRCNCQECADAFYRKSNNEIQYILDDLGNRHKEFLAALTDPISAKLISYKTKRRVLNLHIRPYLKEGVLQWQNPSK